MIIKKIPSDSKPVGYCRIPSKPVGSGGLKDALYSFQHTRSKLSGLTDTVVVRLSPLF